MTAGKLMLPQVIAGMIDAPAAYRMAVDR